MPTRVPSAQSKAAKFAKKAMSARATPAAKPAPKSAGKPARSAASKPATKAPKARSTPAKAKPLPKKAAEVKALGETPINTYSRAVRFLNTLSNFESLRIVRYTPENFNLDRMRALCKRLGNPQTKFKSVHVAGTKGKGSTCAMIAAMLRASGYTVGLYASPHLVDVRERIRILRPDQDKKLLPQGEMIGQNDFAKLTQKVEPFVTGAKLRPTYFDTLTAIAFSYFAEQKVDIAVIETGLGGRIDSTNVIEPEVTAITPISMDHMRQLGPTLAKIASEKAGIFKPGVPAITCEQDPEVEKVLKRVAQENNAPLKILGKGIDFSYRFEASRHLGRHNRVCFNTDQSRFEHLAAPLLGEHQAINCGVALGAIDALRRRGFKQITDSTCQAGLEGLTLEGRLEILRDEEPKVVVDAAHNAASIEAMLRGLGQHFSYDSAVVIFGCCNDKDIGGMLAKLVAGADKIIFTRVDSIRSAEPRDLAQQYTEKFGKMAQIADTLPEALQIARRSSTNDDLICITGSFYLVGQAKKLFAQKAAKRAG